MDERIELKAIAASSAEDYISGMQQSVISRNPEVMGGAPVFRNTRVPVQTLLHYLEASETIDDFLAGFPSVSRQQVIDFLQQAKDRLVGSTR